MTPKALFLSIGLLAALLPAQQAVQGTATNVAAAASGTVEDENGKPIRGAIVMLMPASSDLKAPPKGGWGVSDEKGTFELQGIDPSDYSVCVHVEDPTLLNPCLWPGERTAVTLKASSSAGGLKIRLRKGTTIRFRIEDPEGLLPSFRKPEASGALLVGVWTKEGIFQSARKVSEDIFGQNYVLTVPNEDRARPYVQGAQLRVLEADGTLHQAGSIKDFQPEKSGGERIYQFRVTVAAR